MGLLRMQPTDATRFLGAGTGSWDLGHAALYARQRGERFHSGREPRQRTGPWRISAHCNPAAQERGPRAPVAGDLARAVAGQPPGVLAHDRLQARGGLADDVCLKPAHDRQLARVVAGAEQVRAERLRVGQLRGRCRAAGVSPGSELRLGDRSA